MKYLKKLLAAALSAALLCGVALTTASAADPEAALTDVPSGAWYETAVNWCRTNGIFDFELTDEEMAAMTAIDRNDPFFGGFGGQDELEDAANRWGLDNN